MATLNLVCIWTLCVLFCCGVDCQSLENVKDLTSDLLSDYDNRQRQVLDQSGPVYVNVTMDILAIQVNVLF